MKVLLLGATGNLGVRLAPALLTHGRTVVTYVRTPAKLEAVMPKAVIDQITIVKGDANDVAGVKRALLDHSCDAAVTTAGQAAMAPWGKSDLTEIFAAITKAVQEAGAERKAPLRVWFLGGLGVLYYPGTKIMLSDRMPMFLAHRADIALLRSLPTNAIDWSMLSPSTMVPESSDFSVPTKSTRGKLVANADTPPRWQESWIGSIPLLGKTANM